MADMLLPEEKLLQLSMELDSIEDAIRRSQFELSFLLKESGRIREAIKSYGYPIPIPRAIESETKTYWDFPRVLSA